MMADASSYGNVMDITGNGERVSREELFARQAVQGMTAFPELLVRLTRIFGPGPERDIVHQLVYWFGRAGMQNRWTLYKTFEEWHEERGLNRKQVDRARKRLAPTRIVVEKKGPYKRVHYRIDWVRLQQVLEGGRLYPLKGDQPLTVLPKRVADEPDTPKGGAIMTVPPLGDTVATAPPRVDDTLRRNGEYPASEGVQSNTEAYATEYRSSPPRRSPTGNSSLQEGANGFSSRPAPPSIRQEDEEPYSKEQVPSASHRQQPSSPTPEDLSAELITEIRNFLTEPSEDNEAARLFAKHRERAGSVYDPDVGRAELDVMHALAREFYPGYLSEDLKRHVSAAMRELQIEGVPV